MNNLKLQITINAPINELFWFTLKPQNTPRWIEDMKEERTSQWPSGLGTAYENTWDGVNWSKLVVTEFEEPSTFTLSREDRTYNVRYTFKSTSSKQTEFEYYEWTDIGELESPFKMDYLKRLKELAERELGKA